MPPQTDSVVLQHVSQRAHWPDASEWQLRKFLMDMRVETADIKEDSEEILKRLFDGVLAKLQALSSSTRRMDPSQMLSSSRSVQGCCMTLDTQSPFNIQLSVSLSCCRRTSVVCNC